MKVNECVVRFTVSVEVDGAATDGEFSIHGNIEWLQKLVNHNESIGQSVTEMAANMLRSRDKR